MGVSLLCCFPLPTHPRVRERSCIVTHDTGEKEPAPAVEVSSQLPEQLVEHAKRFGEATHREVGQVFVDTLELMWATIPLALHFTILHTRCQYGIPE
jgi:hypothetical protein